MRQLAIAGTAALLASALAAPASAQQVIYSPGYCAQYYPNANCQNLGPGNPYSAGYRRRAAYNAGWNNSYNAYNRWDDGRTGFGPGDVAAGVVGGAVGTAAAVASAPFGGIGNPGYNSYNTYYGGTGGYYDTGYNGGRFTKTYADRNGIVCMPGTLFRGEDGRQHLCQ